MVRSHNSCFIVWVRILPSSLSWGIMSGCLLSSIVTIVHNQLHNNHHWSVKAQNRNIYWWTPAVTLGEYFKHKHNRLCWASLEHGGHNTDPQYTGSLSWLHCQNVFPLTHHPQCSKQTIRWTSQITTSSKKQVMLSFLVFLGCVRQPTYAGCFSGSRGSPSCHPISTAFTVIKHP